jgi:hypothetical protein
MRARLLMMLPEPKYPFPQPRRHLRRPSSLYPVMLWQRDRGSFAET